MLEFSEVAFAARERLNSAASDDPETEEMGTTSIAQHETASLARFNWLMAVTLGLEASGELLLAPVRTWQLVPSLLYLIPFAAIAWYCHWAQHDRVRDVILAIAWAVALTLLSGPLVEIAARSRLPLADRSLARIDLIQTAAVVNWFRRSSLLTFLSAVAYWVLLPLLVAAIVLPPLCSYRKAMQRFIVSGTVASLVTALIFAIWPAIGPWTVEGYQASQEQELTSTALLMLRAHHSDHSRPPTDAFVSFPSFHTILAILAAIALWDVRKARWVGLALCIAVCIATVTTGWHYTVDVLAGIAVALTCYRASAWLVR